MYTMFVLMYLYHSGSLQTIDFPNKESCERNRPIIEKLVVDLNYNSKNWGNNSVVTVCAKIDK